MKESRHKIVVLIFILLSLSFSQIKDYQLVRASSFLSASKNFVYVPECVLDEFDWTAWVEGASGLGIGEWIEIYLGENINQKDLQNLTITILSGYHKDKNSFLNNSRVKKMDVELRADGVVLNTQSITFPNTTNFSKSRASFILDTKNLPQILKGEVTLRFIIKEAYKGNKWEDVCVSGIYFDYSNPQLEAEFKEYLKKIFSPNEKKNKNEIFGSKVVKIFGSVDESEEPVKYSSRTEIVPIGDRYSSLEEYYNLTDLSTLDITNVKLLAPGIAHITLDLGWQVPIEWLLKKKDGVWRFVFEYGYEI